MSAAPPTVAVVGAGLTGLTAARQLRRGLGPGARILLFEAAPDIGGKLRTADSATGPVEVGAEAYLGFRRDATEFFTELGLADELVEPSGLPSVIVAGGQRHAMPRSTVMGVPATSEGLAGLLSAETLRRIDAEGDPERTQPLHWVRGDDVNLGQLVEARLGREVVDHLVSPLLGGVYSTLADDLGLRATVPQLAEALDSRAALGGPVSLTAAAADVLETRKNAMEARLASSAVRSPIFLTFRNGYRRVYATLLEQAAPELRLSTEVTSVTRADTGFSVAARGASGTERFDVDAVLLAAPAPVTGALLGDVAPEAGELIGGVDLASSAVVAMRFDSDEGLPDYSGILIAADEPVDAKAFTFSSRKWPHLGERGGAVVRASFGRFGDDSLVREDDESLLAKARRDLAKITGFAAEPAEVIVQRWWGGLPRYGVGHDQLMDFADSDLAEVPRIAAAGAWHRGPGVPACIADAKAAAGVIIADLG